jgi:hypothetical protein
VANNLAARTGIDQDKCIGQRVVALEFHK